MSNTKPVERGTRKLFWFRLTTGEGTVFAERDNDSVRLKLKPKVLSKNNPCVLTRLEAIALARDLMKLSAPTLEELSDTERKTGKWDTGADVE